jgi:hypothetical protein
MEKQVLTFAVRQIGRARPGCAMISPGLEEEEVEGMLMIGDLLPVPQIKKLRMARR